MSYAYSVERIDLKSTQLFQKANCLELSKNIRVNLLLVPNKQLVVILDVSQLKHQGGLEALALTLVGAVVKLWLIEELLFL